MDDFFIIFALKKLGKTLNTYIDVISSYPISAIEVELWRKTKIVRSRIGLKTNCKMVKLNWYSTNHSLITDINYYITN